MLSEDIHFYNSNILSLPFLYTYEKTSNDFEAKKTLYLRQFNWFVNDFKQLKVILSNS